jgi:GT2 family glycosyltransferase/2-polyprenyl-3-methyl-5-hydroxy-6-metoxy-1,4-benzoquinol methylase
MEIISSKKEYPLKQISQFVFDQEHNIYTHPDNITIEYQDGGEVFILESMMKVKDLSSHSQEFKQYIKDWPSRYHFSNKRFNFLEAVKEVLPKKADVLEIGSGCGIITRWLGEQYQSVDALEGNIQRAGITRYRTKDLDNVKVYCGNVLATDFDKKYDLITLIGSLEYIPLYDDEHDDPKEACKTLLTRLKSALKENGILLIAIENKFGAKYFSGSKEDHTGREFEGIIGYPNKTPVTFSRNELEAMLSQTGFEHNQFYHVFPDYKMTETIIPENPEVLSLHPNNWIGTPFEEYSDNRLNLFPDLLFLKSLTESGLLWQFSNSFVIVASPIQTINLTVPWLIKKYRNGEYLDPKFYHEIFLVTDPSSRFPEKKFIVNRSPLTHSCQSDRNEKFEFRLLNNEYVSGELFITDFYSALFQKSPDEAIKHAVTDLHNHLLYTYSIDKKDPEDYPLVKGETIDFTFWNLIVGKDQKPVFIDNKWRYKDPLPVDIVLFRNLFNIFEKISPFLKNKNKQQFILEIIQSLYPQYSETRLFTNLELEKTFQSYTSGRVQNFTIKNSVQNSLNEIVLLNQELSVQVTNLNQVIAGKDLEINKLHEQVYDLKEENTSLKSSISYVILSKFNKAFIETLFPNNSKRREIYDLGLKGGRVFFNGGLKKTYTEFKKYMQMKKSLKTNLNLSSEDSEKKLNEKLDSFLSHTKKRLIFPTYEKPLVSIIILTFNKAAYTYQCLESLVKYSDISYEVILVDNGSTDNTQTLLRQIDNIEQITNEKNLGFIQGCNEGSRRANGKYLLFLNNDTIVTENWLSLLVTTAESNRDCGAVGCKLVWLNGQLQEAGSMIFKDGSALGYGRGDNPLKPEYNYLREIDFCSGACLLVRTDIFKRLEGFDERYIPAYYEDADLCIGIQNLGYKIIYQPQVTIFHHEFTSSSKEHATKYMETNRSKFLEKWQESLKRKEIDSPNAILNERDIRKGKKILVIDDRIPASNQGSGYPRANTLLKYLGELGYKVTFFPFDDTTPWQPYTSQFQELGIEIFYGNDLNFKEFSQKRSMFYDLLIVSRPHNFERSFPIIKTYFPNAFLIYDAEALFSTREILKAKVEGVTLDDNQIQKLRDKEFELMKKADLIITVSDNERKIIQKSTGLENIVIFGHPVQVQKSIAGYNARKDILFVGSFLALDGPNEDAIIYFVKEIWPKVQKQLLCKLYIVGINPPDLIKKLASESIIVTGFVPDLNEYYNKCRIFIVPHRYAAGIPLKLIEAMSYGIPSVISSLIASQLNIKDGKEVLVAGDPDGFIEKIRLLYENEKLWKQIQQNAIEYIAAECNPETIKNNLKNVLEGIK